MIQNPAFCLSIHFQKEKIEAVMQKIKTTIQGISFAVDNPHKTFRIIQLCNHPKESWSTYAGVWLISCSQF